MQSLTLKSNPSKRKVGQLTVLPKCQGSERLEWRQSWGWVTSWRWENTLQAWRTSTTTISPVMLTTELWKLWNVITFWWLSTDADTQSTSQTLDDAGTRTTSAWNGRQAQGSISEITAPSAPTSLVTAWSLKTGSELCEDALVDAIRGHLSHFSFVSNVHDSPPVWIVSLTMWFAHIHVLLFLSTIWDQSPFQGNLGISHGTTALWLRDCGPGTAKGPPAGFQVALRVAITDRFESYRINTYIYIHIIYIYISIHYIYIYILYIYITI